MKYPSGNAKQDKQDAKNEKAAHKKMLKSLSPAEKKKSDEFNKKYPAGYMSPAAKLREAKMKKMGR